MTRTRRAAPVASATPASCGQRDFARLESRIRRSMGGMRVDRRGAMKIAEIFYSIQGEGVLTGVPSVFVRTSGCNLRCVWCDTPYTSWQPEGDELTLHAILSRIDEHPQARHVVLTGGEPMIAPQAVEL